MSYEERRVLAAAIHLLATVNPETIRRNRAGATRTGVDGKALAQLAEVVAAAAPNQMATARALSQCSECGHQPWQDYHADDCDNRRHIVYAENEAPVMPPGADGPTRETKR